ncbi:unnamed protein product [Polarella glacialis]|uniref:Uncharacterized protein n=1 Tax=Polarella glacialis TaxID=89957 RepID=A0A813FVK3_POLGL|nr:unnamed protein product [Polarella glacialis]
MALQVAISSDIPQDCHVTVRLNGAIGRRRLRHGMTMPIPSPTGAALTSDSQSPVVAQVDLLQKVGEFFVFLDLDDAPFKVARTVSSSLPGGLPTKLHVKVLEHGRRCQERHPERSRAVKARTYCELLCSRAALHCPDTCERHRRSSDLRSYLSRSFVEENLHLAMQALLRDQPKDPFRFLADFLHSCSASQDDKGGSGVKIPSLVEFAVSSPAARMTGTVKSLFEAWDTIPSEGTVKSLFEATSCDKRGVTPLHLAAESGQDLEVARLLAAGASPDAETTLEGVTALHAACCRGHIAVMRQLLAAGSLPWKARADGVTALHFAAQGGHLEVAEALLEAGHPPDPVDCSFAPLHDAAQGGHCELVARLLLARAAPDTASSAACGSTALHMAAQGGHAEVVRCLLEGSLDLLKEGPHQTRSAAVAHGCRCTMRLTLATWRLCPS